jgi:hypothetical protein
MKSIPMDYTEEETIARREAMLKRMLATPPQHRTAKGDKASPPKKRGRPTRGTFQLLFDTDSVQRQLENMSPFELQFLQDRINEGSSDAFDILVTDSMPAISAGGPEQIIIGLRFNF